MKTLTVTAYNVRFGDAFLIAVPEGKTSRHILVDVGNVLSGEGGGDEVLTKVVGDVFARLDGRPIDLYVMTHEHIDHVQGLPIARSAGLELPVDYSWLTASAAPDFGRRHPDAERMRKLREEEYLKIESQAEALGLMAMEPVRSFLDNNSPYRTADCVSYLKGIARVKTSYVHRTFRLIPGKHHPFREARFSIWAPELDTSEYYGRQQPIIPGVGRRRPPKPAGVDREAFRALIDFVRSGLGGSMLAIDKAANNTSIVFSIQWNGWRLLFTGDAEEKSWNMMARRRQLKPVHFLKVSHHGSHNGTPAVPLLDKILPQIPADDRERHALVSTWPDTYSGVPDETTLERLRTRVTQFHSTRAIPEGESVTIPFPA